MPFQDQIDYESGVTAVKALRQAPPVKVATPSRVYAITTEKQDALVAKIRGGAFNSDACRIAGVSYNTFNDWLERGERDDAQEPYKSFAEAVRTAESEAVEAAREALWGHFHKDWKAAAHYLSKKRPNEWGEKANMQVATTGNVSIYLPDNNRDKVLDGDE